MSPQIELRVDSETFTGFETGDITQSLDAFASSYLLTYDDGNTTRGERAIIATGDPIAVGIGGQTVFDGYVDTTRHAYDGSGRRRRRVSGRSRLGDLVDVSAFGRKHFRGRNLLQIAEELLDGYDVEVESRFQNAEEPFRDFAINEGETIAAALMRAAKLRGVVLVDEGGRLIMDIAGNNQSTTVLRNGPGGNIREGERQTSWRERFSEYVFRGQTRATDELFGREAAELEGRVIDPEVQQRRLRRLVIASWGNRRDDMGVRAVNERNRRAGRSERLVYTVPGWLDDEGLIWRPNQRVLVQDSILDVDAVMLLVRVTTQLRPKVSRTELELSLPSAWDVTRPDYPVVGREGAIT